ncbi:MlaD family protein [Flavobacterium gawalongense]|uniref:MCE family protein n=1 Tax=Flavobacterium gawalongense TaxID=2594432 RepID=A0A553BPE1_9FLAO|nr:MlaD family protein [Flavobacterium gawalongense]TRX01514.1 MCE family protein [Flavobacterium gawalongense]TRX06135.1 MCE family protein [Flavobacterium gawalongense]TRX10110.1 MCE family protein [Flavobacterium gawalongense]TRX11123.1 MCE family protein [Flavobacterium gawalongense]TRX28772.1 MCE family protein [Flavobacterium gawalongense]
MNKESGFQWKLGMFVIIGLVLFVSALYFVGKQKNLFGSTFHLKSNFKSVSGLEVGNNVRFSGINIGTVSEIELVTDSSVVVKLLIKEEVRKFIKTDAIASIGSDGLMGDKVLTIYAGANSKQMVKDNDIIASRKAIDMEDVMSSVKTSVDNAGIITTELAKFSSNMNTGNGMVSKLMTDKEFANSITQTLANLESSSNEFANFTTKMNSGKGALSKLVTDEKMGRTIDSTLTNVKTGTEGLNEVIEAAKHNFLLRGYFNKKRKEENKKLEELDRQEELEMKKELKIVDENEVTK